MSSFKTWDIVKVAGVKVYLRQTWNFRSHAVSACIGLWHHWLMHAPHRLMHCMYCMHCPMTSQADVYSYCMGSGVLILFWIYLYLQLLCPSWRVVIITLRLRLDVYGYLLVLFPFEIVNVFKNYWILSFYHLNSECFFNLSLLINKYFIRIYIISSFLKFFYSSNFFNHLIFELG